MRPILRIFVAVIILLITATAVAQQPQQSAADAEAHFKRGVSLYQESDFKAALVEFRRAYDLSHKWQLLYNVAQAEYQTHDYGAALSTFETYLREGGDKIPRARKAEVDGELARLKERVGRLTIQTNVAGAIVSIDGVELGPAPITRSVTVGERRVSVTKEGYAPWSKTIVVAGGDVLIVDVPLSTASAPPEPPPPPPKKREEASSSRFPWELWAITGVLTAGAVTTGIIALGADSDLDAAKGRFDVTDGELDSAASRVKTFAIVTDVVSVLAVASAVVSVYFTLKSSSPSRSAAFAGTRF